MKFFAALLILCAATASAASNPKIGEPFKIPSDAKASYVVLEKSGKGDIKTIVTRREGSSGVSFSKREYDCKRKLVRYLGSGDTLEQMSRSKPDPKLAPIVQGSIADYVGGIACRS